MKTRMTIDQDIKELQVKSPARLSIACNLKQFKRPIASQSRVSATCVYGAKQQSNILITTISSEMSGLYPANIFGKVPS